MADYKCIIVDVRGDEHSGMLSFALTTWLSWLDEVCRRGGLPGPEVLSACRSAERQREMQQNWDRDMREGLAVRPATNSKHIPDAFGFCHAVDLANDFEWLEIIGRLTLKTWPSIEWGGTYIERDPRHFEEK